MTTERDFGRAGLHEALKRLRLEFKDGVATDAVYFTVAESMEWCYSLSEYHVEQLRLSLGGDPANYRDKTEKARKKFAKKFVDDDGKTLAALSWVRGYSTHGLLTTTALITVPGTASWLGRALSAGPVTEQWRWKQRSEFPPPSMNPHGRDIFYDDHVSGHPLLRPLAAAEKFLLTLS